MATTSLTLLQSGYYDTATGVWTPSTFGFTLLGGTTQTWVHVNKAVPLVNIITALSWSIIPQFLQTGTLTVMVVNQPVVADFSAANPPTGVVTNNVIAGAAPPLALPYEITIAIADAYGKASPIATELRRRWRPDTNGVHRTAIGIAWSGAGGTIFPDLPVLTHEDEFTGWGGRKPALGDRAVRCPRCGTVTTERALVRDGQTRTDVCADCYDPPTPPPNWPRLRGT